MSAQQQQQNTEQQQVQHQGQTEQAKQSAAKGKRRRRFWLKFSMVMVCLFVLLLLVQVLAAGFVFDARINSVLAKVQHRVPALSLRYEPVADSSLWDSLFSRSGRLYVTVKLPAGKNFGGATSLSTAADLKINFGILSVRAAFTKAEQEGNLDKILSGFNLQPVSYEGALQAGLLLPELSFAVKTSPFALPLEDGLCAVGENSLYLKAHSTSECAAEFNGAGLKCKGTVLYAGRDSYDFALDGLSVRAVPRLENGKPYIDSFEIGLRDLLFDVSTLYAIGMGPEVEVKDPTLRDRIHFSGLSTRLAFVDKDDSGKAFIKADSTGNYSFAFPAVKQGQEQPYYDLHNMICSATAGKVDFRGLFRDLRHLQEENASEKVLSNFSSKQSIELNELSFEHEGEKVSVSGSSTADLDFARLKIKQLLADFSLQGGKNFVQYWAGTDYAEPLHQMVQAGQVSFDGNTYSTHLRIDGKSVTLNGLPVSLKAQDDSQTDPDPAAVAAEDN